MPAADMPPPVGELPPPVGEMIPPPPPGQELHSELPPDAPPPPPDLAAPPEPPGAAQPPGLAMPSATGALPSGTPARGVAAGTGPTVTAPLFGTRPAPRKPVAPAVDAKGAPILDTTKKVKLIGSGALAREVQELTPEEKLRRRRRRSFTMMVVGLLILWGVTYLLMQV
jgi:hypothetical protein